MKATEQANRCDRCGEVFSAGGAEGICWFSAKNERFDLCNDCSADEETFPVDFYVVQVGEDAGDDADRSRLTALEARLRARVKAMKRYRVKVRWTVTEIVEITAESRAEVEASAIDLSDKEGRGDDGSHNILEIEEERELVR